MIHDLQPYSKYIDIDLPWLEQIPEHWKIRRGKNIFVSVDIRSETGEEELLTVSSEHGIIPRGSAKVTMFKAESYIGYKLCWPDDLAINSLWAWARGLGVSRYHGIISSAYGVYRLLSNSNYIPAFIHELVRSAPFNWELQVRSKGIWISRLQLTNDAFLNSSFPLPPPDEQASIVRFLDYANNHINKYIRNKRKLIKLLEEQKRAIIHQAVTQGLDTGVPLKDSGFDFLGDIPEHWDVMRLRNVVEMRVSNVDKHIKEEEHPVRLCNYVDVYKNNQITETIPFMEATATEDEITRFKLENKDVLITKDSETWDDIGVPALVDYTAPDLICGYHLALLRPHKNRIHGTYLLRALQSIAIQYQFHVSAKGVTRYGLSHEAINSIWIPIPPLVEQDVITKYIDHIATQLDHAILKTKQEIALLTEYHKSLVSGVVTGHLDVRETAASLTEISEYGDWLQDEIELKGNQKEIGGGLKDQEE